MDKWRGSVVVREFPKGQKGFCPRSALWFTNVIGLDRLINPDFFSVLPRLLIVINYRTEEAGALVVIEHVVAERTTCPAHRALYAWPSFMRRECEARRKRGHGVRKKEKRRQYSVELVKRLIGFVKGRTVPWWTGFLSLLEGNRWIGASGAPVDGNVVEDRESILRLSRVPL